MTPAWRDAGWLAAMLAGYAATAVLPQRFDRAVVGRCARLLFRRQSPRVTRVAERMRSLLGPDPTGQGWRASAVDYHEMKVENAWVRMRGLRRRPGALDIRLQGLEHLREALREGRGAILWRMGFCGSPVAKAALWSAGVPLVHLSRAGHGARSNSWLALRLLCPLHRRAEDVYLAERVVIPLDQSLGYLKVLMERLGQNATISIFGDLVSRQPVSAPFFQRTAAFATGAPSLAWKMGSALLPTYVVREAPLRYVVVMGERLEADPTAGRRAFVQRTIEEFAYRLEGAVRAYPASWLGWGRLETWPGIIEGPE